MSLRKGLSFRPSAKNLLFLVLALGWQEGVICEQSAISANEVGVTSPNINSATSIVKSKLHQQQQNSFVQGGSSSGGDHGVVGNDEYRATYFYPVPHQANWNRDSYSDAANEFGYNQPQQQQVAASVPGSVYTPAYGIGDADGYEDSGFGGGALGGIGGLGGIAGILGLKGLKGLGILGLLKLGLPLLAIIIPALLLVPLLFLFFPVPVITVPATTRNLMSGINFGEFSGKMSSLARSVLESDKCIERISCEMSRVSRGSFIDRTLKRVIPRFEPHMPQALKRIARVYMEGQPSCNKKYSCYLMDDSSKSNSIKSTK